MIAKKSLKMSFSRNISTSASSTNNLYCKKSSWEEQNMFIVMTEFNFESYNKLNIETEYGFKPYFKILSAHSWAYYQF